MDITKKVRGCLLWRFYLLVERPFEQSVTLSPHHHKEQGQVAAAPRPVSIQVDPQAHLVAVLTSVEGWKEERGDIFSNKWFLETRA